jgi:hypothetical protein
VYGWRTVNARPIVEILTGYPSVHWQRCLIGAAVLDIEFKRSTLNARPQSQIRSINRSSGALVKAPLTHLTQNWHSR